LRYGHSAGGIESRSLNIIGKCMLKCINLAAIKQ
jgi:hypothetical protein